MRHLLTLLFSLPGLAFAGNSLSLTLHDAEALWHEHSRELRLADTAVAGAMADMQTAGQRPNPDFSLNALSISPQSGLGGGPLKDKRMDTQFRLDQLIERGGKRDLRLKGAEARIDAARLERDDTARQQLGDLRQAYYNLRLAQEKLELARDTAALYGKSAQAGRLRQKAGDLAPVDVSRLQIDQARAEAELNRADIPLLEVAAQCLLGVS